MMSQTKLDIMTSSHTIFDVKIAPATEKLRAALHALQNSIIIQQS
jgi:hypothetical protein